MHGTPGNSQVDRLSFLVELLNKNATGGRSTWSNVAFFVDPSQSLPTSKDSNNGLTAATAIVSTTELNRRLFDSIIGVPTATITYLSDDNSGDLLDLSTVLVPTGVVLTFQGTPQVLHTGGTLNAGTIAINPAAAGGGQQQTAHTTDIADWTPFIPVNEVNGFGTAPHPAYLLDTTGVNNGTSAWIVSDGGGDAPHTIATADLSRPVTSGFVAGSLTIGDRYKIQRGSLLSVAGTAAASGEGTITFADFAFTLLSVGVNGCTYNRCSFDNAQSVGGTYNHCFLSSDIIELGLPVSTISLNSGVVYTFDSGRWSATITISGDTYFTGVALILGTAFGYADVIILPGIGVGVCINRNSGGVGLVVGVGAFDLGSPDVTGQSALIWGNSNGRGMVLGPNSAVTVSATTPPTVTGSALDFGFRVPTGPITTTARAFDPTTGEYTEIGGVATRTTTWPHFSATIAAGGFNFQAHLPESNAHLVGG